MSDKLTEVASQCGAKFMNNGVGFDAESWRRFVRIVGLLLPDGEAHERIRHADSGPIDLFYAVAPTASSYEYIAKFCNFQATYLRDHDAPPAVDQGDA